MKTVLVTGATGFIGRQCLDPLIARGFEVHATGRGPSSFQGSVQFHQCDLLEPAQLAQVVAAIRPTHVLHCAWDVAHGTYWSSEDNLRWIEASLHLARIFRECGGKRLVVVGTSAEYDWSVGTCVEGVPSNNPPTIYGAAKHALHVALMPWAKRAQIGLVWARMFFLYGPHEQRERLVPYAIRTFLRREQADFSAGEQIRDFQHVRDAGGALAMLVDSDFSGPVNVASGRSVAVRDVVLEIARQLNAIELAGLGMRPASQEPPLVVADVRTLRETVGWRDHYDLSSGIAETIAWWRTQPQVQI